MKSSNDQGPMNNFNGTYKVNSESNSVKEGQCVKKELRINEVLFRTLRKVRLL